MIITNGGFGNAGGRIAMGNNLPDGFVPQDRLHLNQSAGQTFMRFTNNIIGSGAGNGFRIGIIANGVARLIQNQTQPMQFWIFDQNPSIGGVTRRAEFTAGGQMDPGPTGGGNVDGLRIWNPGYVNSLSFSPISSIDIWTGSSSTTHIRMDESGSKCCFS